MICIQHVRIKLIALSPVDNSQQACWYQPTDPLTTVNGSIDSSQQAINAIG